VALESGATRQLLRVSRALALALAGQPERAVAEANALVSGSLVRGETFYQSACIHAVAARATPDPKRREEYSARSVEPVRRADGKGLFRSELSRKQLSHPLFDVLREREDFKKLLAELSPGGRGG